MCNQTVSLIAAEAERRGMSTVVLQLLREVAVAVRPPRALIVPFPHGFPLGASGNPEKQHQVLRKALDLLEEPGGSPPRLRDFADP